MAAGELKVSIENVPSPTRQSDGRSSLDIMDIGYCHYAFFNHNARLTSWHTLMSHIFWSNLENLQW